MDSLRCLCHRRPIDAIPGLYTLKRSISGKYVSLRLRLRVSPAPWILSRSSVDHLACYRRLGTSIEFHMSEL